MSNPKIEPNLPCSSQYVRKYFMKNLLYIHTLFLYKRISDYKYNLFIICLFFIFTVT